MEIVSKEQVGDKLIVKIQGNPRSHELQYLPYQIASETGEEYDMESADYNEEEDITVATLVIADEPLQI